MQQLKGVGVSQVLMICKIVRLRNRKCNGQPLGTTKLFSPERSIKPQDQGGQWIVQDRVWFALLLVPAGQSVEGVQWSMVGPSPRDSHNLPESATFSRSDLRNVRCRIYTSPQQLLQLHNHPQMLAHFTK